MSDRYGIDVVIDPSPAVAGGKGVEEELRRMQAEADAFNRAAKNALEGLGRAAGGAVPKLAPAKASMSALIRETNALRASLDPVVAAKQRLAESTNILNRALRAKIITTREYDELIRKERVHIDEVTAAQARQAAGGATESGAGLFSRARGRLNNTFGTLSAIGIVGVVGEATKLGDEMQVLKNKLKPVAKEGENVNNTFRTLRDISHETRGSISGTVTVYSRMAQASRELGVNQQQMLHFTEQLNKAVKVNGGSAVEAEQGMIQLSQGMAIGTLRGQDLKSVISQIPYVADLIAEHLHVTRGELLKMGEDGKISAHDVFDAISNAEEVDRKFATTTATTSEKIQRLKDDVGVLSGKLAGFVGTVVEGIDQLVNFRENLDKALHPEDYAKNHADKAQILLAQRLELQDEIVAKESEYNRQTATGKLYLGEQLVELKEQAAELDRRIEKEAKLGNAEVETERRQQRFAGGLHEINDLYKTITGSTHGIVTDYDAMIASHQDAGRPDPRRIGDDQGSL